MKKQDSPFGFPVPRLPALLLAAAILFGTSGPTAAAEGKPSPDVAWSGTLSVPSPHTPAWIGYRFLESRKKALGLRNPRQDMLVTEIADRADGGARVYYQRYLYRTPVWGDGLAIEIDRQGVIRRVTGRMHADLEQNLFHRPKRPALSAARAAAEAAKWLESQGLSAEIGEVRACYLPDRPGSPLVYLVKAGPDGHLFVHGLTGRVIKADI